jgi:hypothetical protein
MLKIETDLDGFFYIWKAWCKSELWIRIRKDPELFFLSAEETDPEYFKYNSLHQ